MGYSPWGHKRIIHDLTIKQQQQISRLMISALVRFCEILTLKVSFYPHLNLIKQVFFFFPKANNSGNSNNSSYLLITCSVLNSSYPLSPLFLQQSDELRDIFSLHSDEV